MKKYLTFALALGLAVSCGNSTKEPVQSMLSEYATVEIGKEDTPLLEGISDNGREVLNLYRFAAIEAGNIYWQQAFSDKAALDSLEDASVKQYAMINYGPWDRMTGEAFVEGYGERPAGLCFYPEDMTAEEFEAFQDPLKNSPYTLIRRAEDGSLKCVWYHEAYKENIEKICNYLRAAADITIVPGVKDYLLAKADALSTDEYYESDCKWLDMDSKMDLVLGPSEAKDDNLYGIKRSYDAYVVLKDVERSAALADFSARIASAESQEADSSVKNDILVCDALYYAGAADAGIKDIAINLPFDPTVQETKGTRTILMQNVIMAKFNSIMTPLAGLLLSDEDKVHVTDEAFFWITAFRELSHSLGVNQTAEGGSIEEALGNLSAVIEDAKADAMGANLAIQAIGNYQTKGIVTPEDAVASFVASSIRCARFGNEVSGRAALICYNYLLANGAFQQHPDNRYYIDYDAAKAAVNSLSEKLVALQANGSYADAESFVNEYSTVGSDLEEAFMYLRTEHIPVDIAFKFVW
jgi:hypothetical protein